MAENILEAIKESNCERDNEPYLNVDLDLSTDIAPDDDIVSYSDELSHTVPSDLSKICEVDSSGYFAGYIARMILKKYDCQICQNSLTCSNESLSSSLFIYFKQFENVKKGLIYPSKIFKETICKFGKIFEIIFEAGCYKKGVRQIICNELRSVDNSFLLCQAHSPEVWNIIIDLYSRTMLFNKLRYLTKDIQNSKKLANKIKKLK